MLLNPSSYGRDHADARTSQLFRDTIAFFEKKGLGRIKQDDQAMTWYEDFLAFVKDSGAFATLLTPAGVGGAPEARWDMGRIAEYNEVLAFYGLCYWYAWQVSILGLGPIWMSKNAAVKQEAAKLLAEGAVFAFGLSERTHGADIYATDMVLTPNGDGTYRANGSKYYIGNGNCAAMVSVFGRFADTGDYVFFVARPGHSAYELVKKIDTSGVRQAFVAEFALHDYPVREADILSRGQAAWDAALSTVNIGKFELGFASIGIATHCLYEAINHAADRRLYGKHVTDFPHVQRLFTEAYARLIGMKLFGLRARDYLRAASADDRRYLLWNPIVKMRVTGEGERVVALLHEVIAAKGYEQDTYFEMAIRDIGMLPKLEGTEHVNMALIIKFVQAYLFAGDAQMPEIPFMHGAGDDSYLFSQHTGGLSKVKFGDFRKAYDRVELPNVVVFKQQLETFRTMLIKAPPSKEQAANVDYMLAGGQLFTLIAYGQLVLEGTKQFGTDPDVIDTLFGVLVRDFSNCALQMVLGYGLTQEQETFYRAMLLAPVRDGARLSRVWRNHVYSLKGRYAMSP